MERLIAYAKSLWRRKPVKNAELKDRSADAESGGTGMSRVGEAENLT